MSVRKTASALAKPAWLPVLRSLVRCAQSFERYSAQHVRELGLTPAQFDVIVTLGNTPGMSCAELGEKTLITKGTLTGVLDRLEGRGLITRRSSPDDARRVHIALTAAGDRLFAEVFPAHLQYCDRAFRQLPLDELLSMQASLHRLSAAFDRAKAQHRLQPRQDCHAA